MCTRVLPVYPASSVVYNSAKGITTSVLGPQTDTDNAPARSGIPETEAERSAIREQLQRILASPLFKNSKRYPNLLRFVVERALEGHTDALKERTLGIDVFGREPDYDTNLDPVVRTTAVEIRKRIAQYYREEGHQSEIRIDFPAGTYMPEFRMPPKPAVSTVAPEPSAKTPRFLFPIAIGASCLAAAGVLFATLTARESALDRFWAPVVASDAPVSVYIGSEKGGEDATSVKDLRAIEQVAFADATTLAKVTAFFAAKGKSYRIRLQPSSRVEDLKDGPAVLIGAFNNSWTLRLTDQMRFSFARSPQTQVFGIRDRDHPDSKAWSGDDSVPYRDMKQDFAIVSRVIDPATGKMVVTASGLAQFGTEAAGEFLTSAEDMRQIEQTAPHGWSRMNMEIVLVTDVIGRRAGPPRVVAAHYW